MGFNFHTKSVNYVTAKQIKQFSNEEPRLMAKMDTIEDQPQIFRDDGVFLLPISRQAYAIVKGNGYHQLEKFLEPPIVHKTSYPFPISGSDVISERVYLDYAFSSGLLAKFAGTSNLNISFGDKRTTPPFSFKVNESIIQVDRAQIEIDAVYESRDEIIVVEAKIGLPTNFSIKQLYYPFRTFFGRKKVRNIFFCFDPKLKTYSFGEYKFKSSEDFESIEFVSSKRYEIEISDVISAKEYRKIRPTIREDIPQANDINKIIQFPYRVFDGYDTSEKMIDAFCFVRLTPKAEVLLNLPPEQKSTFVCKLLLEFPLMNKIFLDISVNHNKVVTRQEIVDMLQNYSHLTGDTLGRRAQTIIAWFRWIRNNLGMVEIERNGNIRLARQMRLG
jgi:hypothetical protein